jgi:dihydrolipoamide dehydrogenase
MPWPWTTVPRRLLIVGGGIIGLEMAQVYSALGSEITVVEMQGQIIPPADRDLVQPLFLKLKKKYRIWTETRVAGIEAGPAGIEVVLEGGTATAETFDAVLVAVGRRPNTQGFGLETMGLSLDERGFVPVNERQQTGLPHFYAIGDVVGEPMLAHKASHQGKVAAEVIAGLKSAFTPMTIPSVAYTSARGCLDGADRKEAEQRGVRIQKGTFPWGASGRALSSRRRQRRKQGAVRCGNGPHPRRRHLRAQRGRADPRGGPGAGDGRRCRGYQQDRACPPDAGRNLCLAAEMVDGSITDALPPKKKGCRP